jgi:YegS/Rv2252/BmrU family lipid kinase
VRPSRVKIVVNPAAGTDQAILGTLNDVFGGSGIEWDVVVTNKPGDARKAASAAQDEGYDLVAAYGGDGTIMEVAAGLAETGQPMAILPGGTANVMAGELGIPADLDGAARLIAGGNNRLLSVDMGEAGRKRFLLRLAVGFEAVMVEGATPEMKEQYGAMAYVLSAFQALADPPHALYRLVIDGRHEEREGVTCIVANAGRLNIGDLSLAPGIDVADGLLDLVVVTSDDLQTLLGAAGDIMAGRESPAIQHWQGEVIRIEAKPTQGVICDGEQAGKTPVEVRVMPGAIEIVVPA